MIKIEVKDNTVNTREIKGANGTYSMHEIDVWAHLDPDGYPEKIRCQVDDGFTCELGEYRIHPKSFYVGKYNRLELGKLILAKV
jgi:hypothetical protein